MHALPLQDNWGLAADGAFHAAVTETVAARMARLRAKLLTVGVPAAIIGGGVTTLVFAGAFRFARSERVWAPALWLGGVSIVGGLLSLTMAAHAVNKAEEAETPPPMTEAERKTLFGY